MIKLIENNQDLEDFCQKLSSQEFITVDLEFLREKTYYAKLCLIQVGSLAECAIIDPLAPDIDLQPFFSLLTNPAITKVFHSCRQDIEIIYLLSGIIPTPLFDTQIAAMAFGYGECISYEHLVKDIVNIELDKSCRLSDWSLRPLDATQLEYAICDVTHLIKIYEHFRDKFSENHRDLWLKEEYEILQNPETYIVDPETAWQRLRHRSHNPKYLTILRELAAWRERRAQLNNTPRQSMIKDDYLLNIASQCPQKIDDLLKVRNLRHDIANGRLGTEMIGVINAALQLPESSYVTPPQDKMTPNGCSSLYELLKLLLKIKSQQENIVPRLIASDSDLRNFSIFRDKKLPMLTGWRREVFGEEAIALRQGELTISFNPQEKNIELKKGS